MKKVSQAKLDHLKKLSTDTQVISALAIDQRGSLKKMLQSAGEVEDIQKEVEQFKIAISEELTPYAASILLDPEYGLPAAAKKDADCGLLLAYEETGYDASEVGRLPDLLPDWSAKRIKEEGADAVKFLLYYDVDEDEKINNWKHAFVERIGSECQAEDIPFFLEILSYDANIDDAKGKEYAKVRPHKVNEAVKVFSDDRYQVDVLKVEVPVNMNFVEGYGDEAVYSQEEAKKFFQEQDAATDLPYIYLSGGVSAQLFQDTLKFAKEAGAVFNGVLCGRATWADAVPEYAEKGEAACREWLSTQGKENIQSLNQVLAETATPWTDKISAE
ncbi:MULTISPECIES: tagatose-bisphosphate aldolase [Aerococcus]|uniref:Tagatose 1,6-diphosphate aldolase n=1 Tax=Aerococcus sanguinicola TaxID=119206 RepID=A0A5N1GGR3_9LACT|nr:MULTISPECIES: tagatose-bisphosphate aldolase [Aerococcus]KAA9300157.1 tagatose-bisphosphate aldolase [Aerococcus sanguinicola]MDK6369499.1 tagatose-bisphosphate aldolase [Aerococcus sp. UMB9870]MDK6679986.1 tagatose-bisphosphate aldolase [Aerococcus sp. UMB8608]MDK6686132.1 tagatose-bisphosphate aldolase [Aerococcus sp. UMB8623]MDK6939912.1 tagatose-bisphosphate aldolase [Aerococcus sp. UMB8487]